MCFVVEYISCTFATYSTYQSEHKTGDVFSMSRVVKLKDMFVQNEPNSNEIQMYNFFPQL